MILDGESFFARHRARDIGRNGIRRVSIEVLSHDEVIVTYLVDHVWQADGRTCKSLMHLTAPQGISGTSILMIEQPGSFTMDLWLKLRTARRPLAVAAERALQHVLGTDFCYEDLRFWYPTDDLEVDTIERITSTASTAQSETLVRAHRRLPDGTAALCVLRGRDDGALIEVSRMVEHIKGSERVMRSTDWHQRDSRAFPTVMIVERMGGAYVSRMYLIGINFDVVVPPDLFSVDNLMNMSPAAYASFQSAPI